MLKLISKIILNVIGILAIYQQSRHCIQDIFGFYQIENAVVVDFGEGWEPSDGEGTINPREMLIVRFKNGKIESGLTRIKYGIQKGDTVTCKLYGDVDPVFVRHKGNDISPGLLSNVINWLVTIIIAICLYFFTLKSFIKNISKNMKKLNILFLFLFLGLSGYAQKQEVRCSNTPSGLSVR